MPQEEGVQRFWTRRSALALLGAVPLAVSSAARGAVCGDPATLSAAQKSMRKSLGFKAPSPDAAKHCALCSFFTPAAGGCGACALLSGGSVPPDGVCDSFAKKG